MDLLKMAQDAAPYVIAILVASTALAHALQAGAHALSRYAAKTASKADDEIAARAVKVADAIAGALDLAASILPRLSIRGRQ